MGRITKLLHLLLVVELTRLLGELGNGGEAQEHRFRGSNAADPNKGHAHEFEDIRWGKALHGEKIEMGRSPCSHLVVFVPIDVLGVVLDAVSRG